MFALQVIPSIIYGSHIVQVICVQVVILSSCLSVLLIRKQSFIVRYQYC